jgi:hypothetical protein
MMSLPPAKVQKTTFSDDCLHGYHRLCAVYKFDEDAMIPCKIV